MSVLNFFLFIFLNIYSGFIGDHRESSSIPVDENALHEKESLESLNVDPDILSILADIGGYPMPENIDKKLTEYYLSSTPLTLNSSDLKGAIYSDSLVSPASLLYKQVFKGGEYSSAEWGYFLKLIRYNVEDADVFNFIQSKTGITDSMEIVNKYNNKLSIGFQLAYDSDNDAELDKLATEVVIASGTSYYATFDLGGKCPPKCLDYDELYNP